MPINLSKGQKVDLTKKNPGLKKIMVGLGWDVNVFDSGADFDLDAAAFMLGTSKLHTPRLTRSRWIRTDLRKICLRCLKPTTPRKAATCN